MHETIEAHVSLPRVAIREHLWSAVIDGRQCSMGTIKGLLLVHAQGGDVCAFILVESFFGSMLATVAPIIMVVRRTLLGLGILVTARSFALGQLEEGTSEWLVLVFACSVSNGLIFELEFVKCSGPNGSAACFVGEAVRHGFPTTEQIDLVGIQTSAVAVSAALLLLGPVNIVLQTVFHAEYDSSLVATIQLLLLSLLGLLVPCYDRRSRRLTTMSPRRSDVDARSATGATV